MSHAASSGTFATVAWVFVSSLVIAVQATTFDALADEFWFESQGLDLVGASSGNMSCGTVKPEWFRCHDNSPISPTWCRYQNSVSLFALQDTQGNVLNGPGCC